MARVAHVRTDAAVSTVSAATHNGGLLDLDVEDVQLVQVEVLGFSIGLGVLEEIQKEAARLLGPATLGHAIAVSLSLAADTTVVHTEGNDVLSRQDVIDD